MTSTVKVSRALKSSSGSELEKKHSHKFHGEGLPLLVSSALLRGRNLGQLDLGRIRKDHQGWIIEIGEVKSSEVGNAMMERSQLSRITHAQKFLSGLFGHRTRLIRLIK